MTGRATPHNQMTTGRKKVDNKHRRRRTVILKGRVVDGGRGKNWVPARREGSPEWIVRACSACVRTRLAHALGKPLWHRCRRPRHPKQKKRGRDAGKVRMMWQGAHDKPATAHTLQSSHHQPEQKWSPSATPKQKKRATPILVGAIAAEQGNVDLALMDGRAAARRPAAASLLVVVKLPKLIRPLPVLVLRQCRVNVKAAVAVRVVAANEGRESE